MDEARPEVGGGINFPKVKLEVIDLTSSLEVESIHTYGGGWFRKQGYMPRNGWVMMGL